MDSVFPFFMICIVPLLWSALMFMIGRWSVRYRLRIEPQQGQSPYRQPAGNNRQHEFYDNFEEV